MYFLAAHIKKDDLTKTMRFCFDRNWTHPPTAASYLTPVVAHSLRTSVGSIPLKDDLIFPY